MNPAAAQLSPGYAAVNLRLVPTTASLRPPDEPHFLYEPPQGALHGALCGVLLSRETRCRPLWARIIAAKSRHPRDSFRQAPHDSVCHFTNTHEAGAPVPPLSAMAGATFHSIPLAGCPASLPPNLIKLINLAHGIPYSFVSRKPNVTGKPLHNAQEKIAADE